MSRIRFSVQNALAGLGVLATIIALYEFILKERVAPYQVLTAVICEPDDPIAHQKLTDLAKLIQRNDAKVIYLTINVNTGCDKGDPAFARFEKIGSNINHSIDVRNNDRLILSLSAPASSSTPSQSSHLVYLTANSKLFEETPLSRIMYTQGGNLGLRIVGLFVPRGEYFERDYYGELIGVGYSKELDDIHKCTHSVAHANGLFSRIYNYAATCVLGISPDLKLES